MKIGLNTDGFAHLALEPMLDRVAQLGMSTVEFGMGGWSSAPHVNIDRLLASARDREHLSAAVRDRGLSISALNCSGNQLHPGETGSNDSALAYKTLELAGLLGVERVVMMSGLPGGPGDANPNWITSSWPLEAMQILDWQWQERALPWWKAFAPQAEKRGVRLCVEGHGRQLVYNASSFFRLYDAVGPTVGVNFDPSHLIWMGGDPVSAIRELGEHIYHVHGKDTRVEVASRIHGLLDTRHVIPVEGRNWNFVSLGHGTSVRGWQDMIQALLKAGYDDVISIENEDYSMSPEEAVATSCSTLSYCLGKLQTS